MRIYLIGFMGSGKSTLGKVLAKEMGLELFDTDQKIEDKYNSTISELFETIGEARFRVVEHAVLKETITKNNIIISTGGGTPCFYSNMDIMLKNGLTIYLKYNKDFLKQRLLNESEHRPLIKDRTGVELESFIDETLTRREQFYNQAAIIYENVKPDSQKIIELINQHHAKQS